MSLAEHSNYSQVIFGDIESEYDSGYINFSPISIDNCACDIGIRFFYDHGHFLFDSIARSREDSEDTRYALSLCLQTLNHISEESIREIC